MPPQDDEISEAGRRERFERWEKLGLEAVKDDLREGGHRLIGGPPKLRELAREWVRLKEAVCDTPEAVTLKPGLYGMSVDLKEVARRIRKRWRKS